MSSILTISTIMVFGGYFFMMFSIPIFGEIIENKNGLEEWLIYSAIMMGMYWFRQVYERYTENRQQRRKNDLK